MKPIQVCWWNLSKFVGEVVGDETIHGIRVGETEDDDTLQPKIQFSMWGSFTKSLKENAVKDYFIFCWLIKNNYKFKWT